MNSFSIGVPYIQAITIVYYHYVYYIFTMAVPRDVKKDHCHIALASAYTTN